MKIKLNITVMQDYGNRGMKEAEEMRKMTMEEIIEQYKEQVANELHYVFDSDECKSTIEFTIEVTEEDNNG